MMILPGLLLTFNSCNKENPNQKEEEEAPTVFGAWHLDKLTIEASSSVIGSGGSASTDIDFSRTNCRLVLDESQMLASARLGLDIDVTSFTFDESTNIIKFGNTLSVSDDGKAMVLTGAYDVIELTDSSLVLKQQDIDVSVPGLFTAHQTAIYTYHREKE